MANKNPKTDLEHLRRVADYLVDQGVSKNTHKSYNLALSKLTSFRALYKLKQKWPVPVDDLLNFIAFLSVQGLSWGSISSYISGISFSPKIKGIQDSTNFFIINKALGGIKRLQGGKQPDIRSPISLDLLEKITAALDKICKDKYEATLFATVISIAFFGLLRVGEITSSKNQSFNNASLKLQGITVYEKSVELRIQWSKTDQKGRSVKLCIPGNGKIYCPLELIKNY